MNEESSDTPGEDTWPQRDAGSHPESVPMLQARLAKRVWLSGQVINFMSLYFFLRHCLIGVVTGIIYYVMFDSNHLCMNAQYSNRDL